MPAWATFAGFAFVVTAGLLLLSYASRGAVPDDQSAVSPDDQSAAVPAEQAADTHDAEGTGRYNVDRADRPDDIDGAAPHGENSSAHGDAHRSPIPESRSSSAGRPEAPNADLDSSTIDEDPDLSTAELDPPSAAPERPRNLSTGALLANVALSQGLFGALLLAGAWYAEIPAWAFGVGPDTAGVGAVALGAVFGVALYAANEAGAALGAQFDLGGGERLRRALAPETPLGWATLLLVVLPIIAGFEELLFRGALVGVLSAGFDVSPWLLAVVSSGAFALGHGAQGRLGVLVTGALGFVLAAGYIVTGSLLVVAVAHYLVNALEFLIHEGLGVEWPPEAD